MEAVEIALASGRTLRAPTVEETLRVKAFLIVRRNQTRDYLDVAALSDRVGVAVAGGVLAEIDDYYSDQHGTGRGVASRLSTYATGKVTHCAPPTECAHLGPVQRGPHDRWYPGECFGRVVSLERDAEVDGAGDQVGAGAGVRFAWLGRRVRATGLAQCGHATAHLLVRRRTGPASAVVDFPLGGSHR